MRKRTRSILFYIFTFLFFVTTPSVLLYAQGFRVDLAQARLVKTGGLALRPSPNPVKVDLNGQLKMTTNFVFRDAVLRNLIPQEYDVALKKDGYAEWSKKLTVRSGTMTEVPHSRVFQQSQSPVKAKQDELPGKETEGPLYIYYLQPESVLLYRRPSSTTTQENPMQLSLRDLPAPVSEAAEVIVGNEERILVLNNKILYLWLKKNQKFDKIADGVKGAKFAQNADKFVYWNDVEIKVKWLDSQTRQPQREAGEEELVVRSSQTLGEVLWLPPDFAHIIFQAGQKIHIAEIDGRGGRNIVTIYGNADKKSPLLVSEGGKKLYFQQNGEYYWISLI